ncbi:hypothetical protein THAOC_10599, partial [Thalassiosira oceanica]
SGVYSGTFLAFGDGDNGAKSGKSPQPQYAIKTRYPLRLGAESVSLKARFREVYTLLLKDQPMQRKVRNPPSDRKCAE